MMEQQLLLPLLRPKLALVANLGSVSHVIARKRFLLRLSCYNSVRNLGLDYSAWGRQVLSRVRNTRISKVIGRARRLAFLKAGPSRSANIARSMPMGLYGAGVTNMLVAQVARLRTAVHIGVLPNHLGNLAPSILHCWAGRALTQPSRPYRDPGLHCNWIGRPMLTQMYNFIVAKPLPLHRTFGPIGVAIANLPDLECTHLTGYAWHDDMMESVQLNTVSPYECKKLAHFWAVRKLWRAASHKHEHLRHLDVPPLLQPMLPLLNVQSPAYLGRRQSSALRAYLSGKFSVCSGSNCTCGTRGFLIGGARPGCICFGLSSNLSFPDGVRLAGRCRSLCS